MGSFAWSAFTHSARLSTSLGAIAMGVSHAGTNAIRFAILRRPNEYAVEAVMLVAPHLTIKG